MDGTGTLLDFGDDPSSPQSTPLAPSGGATLDPTPNHANGDPFDPFGDALFGGPEVMKTNDVTQTSQGFAFADDTDLFDPFASPKMSVETVTTNGTTSDVTQDQQQNYEAQFADLLGDLGDGSTAIQNGDINGTVTTVTKTTTEVSGGGDVITNSTVTVETDSDGGQIQEPDPSAQAFSSDDVRSESTAQFEDTLADYQPPKRPTKKDESKETKGPSVFITPATEPPKEKVSKPLKFLGAGADNMCKKCNKRVYEMEKIIADKAIFHKSCFRCAHCKRVLTLGNFAGIDEQTYCKPHFIELFKKKGKYDMAKQTQEKSRDPQPQPAVREVQAAQVESTQSAAPTRVNGSADDEDEETKKAEPVRYQQMNSVRNMFETASRSTPTQSAPPQKKTSKWDKPRDPSPVPPQQDPEPEPREEDLPPTTITRNLVARFKEIEHGGETYAAERKAVHKITPPREELAAGIEEARQQQMIREDSPEPPRSEDIVKSGAESNTEDERPPPQLTRQMLAKFKSLEDVNQPPSPQPSKSLTKTTPPADKTQYKQRQSSRASPDSGIVDVDHHQSPLNGHHSDTKQGDDEEETKEMPEQGSTQNLLAKWRCIEETSPEPVLPVSRSNSGRQKASSQTAVITQQRTLSPAPDRGQHEVTSPAGNGLDYEDGEQGREVIREGDTNEEEFMPPPSFTKNMLAKFQTMEAEAERQAATEQTLPARKHFKWTVKETPLMSRSGMVWQEKRRDSSMDGEFDEDRSRNEQDSYRDDYREESDEQVFYQSANKSEQHHDHIHRQSKTSVSVDRSSKSYEMRDSHSDDDNEMHHREPTHSVSLCDQEDELPPQALTRNMLAKFRSIEDVNRPPPSPVRSQQQQKVAYSSTTGSGTRKFSSTSSLNQQDTQVTHVYSDREDELEEHYDNGRDFYENEVEGGEFENDPYHDPDLIRESDRAEEEELPEEGITRNLLAKFQSLTAAH